MTDCPNRQAASTGAGRPPLSLPVFLLGLLMALGACSSAPPEKDPAVARPEQAMREGVRAFRRDDYPAAEQRFLEALARFRSIDHIEGEADALINLAETALARSETEHARIYLREARALDPGEPDRLDLIAARIALADNAHGRVRTLTDKLLTGATPEITRAALVLRARSAMASGDERAEPWLARLKRKAEEAGEPLLTAAWLRIHARTTASAGERRAALERALAIYREARYRPGLAAARSSLGDLAAEEGEWPTAWRHYRRALVIRLWLTDRQHASRLIDRMLSIADDVDETPAPDVLRDWREYLTGDNINWQQLREQSSGL